MPPCMQTVRRQLTQLVELASVTWYHYHVMKVVDNLMLLESSSRLVVREPRDGTCDVMYDVM